jgi:hypothetical protein
MKDAHYYKEQAKMLREKLEEEDQIVRDENGTALLIYSVLFACFAILVAVVLVGGLFAQPIPGR